MLARVSSALISSLIPLAATITQHQDPQQQQKDKREKKKSESKSDPKFENEKEKNEAFSISKVSSFPKVNPPPQLTLVENPTPSPSNQLKTLNPLIELISSYQLQRDKIIQTLGRAIYMAHMKQKSKGKKLQKGVMLDDKA